MRLVSSVRISIVLFLAVLLPTRLQGQDPVRVTVTMTILDVFTGDPIQGVLAAVEDLGVEVTSGADGTLVMSDIPVGPHDLSLQREGYETESGRFTVDKAGDMVIRMKRIGGPDGLELSRVGGTVRGLENGDRLEGVAVMLPGIHLSRLTDSDGRFSFDNVPPGDHSMTVELLGYSSREEIVRVESGKILTMDLTLAVRPIELDPIEVSVEARDMSLELSGFYKRRIATSGHFITRDRVEERAPAYTTDLFQGLAGVRVATGLGMGTQRAVVLTGGRQLSLGLASSSSGMERPCYPTVWLDGQMVHQGTASPMEMGPAFIDNLISPENIAGVEVYNSPASVPVQYNLYSACGVIVLWTRQGR